MDINKEVIKNNRLVRHGYYLFRGLTQRERLKAKAAKTLCRFGVHFSTEDEKSQQISDMIRMNTMYGYSFEEYLYYHFSEKNRQERKEFVADWEHLGYTCAMNKFSNACIFDNKWNTVQKYKKYYRRAVAICGRSNELDDKDGFVRFVSEHPDFIVKPINESCGHGVKIYHINDFESVEALYDEIIHKIGSIFIVEELIQQTKDMKKYHPASVNTVRVPTITIGEHVKVIHPFFRIGQHGNCVDNGGAGGIICALDVDQGTILAAADEYGNQYTTHPDTGTMIIGQTIPRWQEAKDLVAELAKIVPDNHYTGWDLALTDMGWVLVEANRRGQFIWQIPTQVGFRKEINRILKQLNVRY